MSAVRASLSTSSRNTSWIGVSAAPAIARLLSRTLRSSVRSPAGPSLLAIRWRIGPHCMVMISCRPSRRYGVAVRPRKWRAGACRTYDSNENGRQVVALVDHDQAVAAEERFEVVDRLEALDHRQVDDPGEFAPSAADLADLLRGESEQRLELCSPLLEQRLAVGEDRASAACRAAISAQAITVLPVPGGATRTPSSFASIGGQGCLLKRRQARRRNSSGSRSCVGRRSSITSRLPAARDRIVELLAEAARQLQVRQRLVVTADQPRCLMGRESQPLAFVEERVMDRGEVLELGKK